ncbi:MAG: imidazoleglycerol-phosphate dehydratase HisB [Nitrospina sp.]|jgi:imidazoleglycerol-phosphate dehydratase|nr:imidazoleglycerol-phosphate dehydratase HisB [Nitrospina sp.]MBT3414768.1 imidazoleglycerol-phosphate dehydratase HisB [Nitrospina sp.]MBT3855342.1 imidazoleglycerol-phosphate dehydratase HisB [Nitrospina sp.]MBT4104127.1 imidazoleglycerol-phosphate dehydratase HisB [Nitrospina sp.]MBT4388314.1 imidazoleglycerol-phosphate dehydratase HisB [Nitrospina sp.]
MARTSHVKRSTSETQIEVTLNLDGTGIQDIQTPVPFLDHMLAQLARHGYFDLTVKAKGDTHIDFHHTVEDVGIAVGQAFKEALGDKRGIRRFAESSVPLNEALAQCIVDISGRAFFVFNLELPKTKLGEFDVELVPEFFQAFSANSDMTLHLNSPYWNNLHHITEALFKAFARALDSACTIDSRSQDVPSTKGTL